MKKVLIALGLVVVFAVVVLVLTREAPPEPIVRTADAVTRTTTVSGEVIGYVEPNGTWGYLGVPYATPPVGELRWRAPLPPARWQGNREAVAAGNVCPQIGSVLAGTPPESYGQPVGDEDCLYLNIWRPADAAPGTLPVMYWIHGGGNSIGHGASSTYWGANLAGTHDVVVVSINYRLGPFGWFRHPALRTGASTELDQSGNYGTLDVVRGLEWVRDNITAFGGDPDNVTIFGESAGGVNVLTMMASPLAEGLYHRAIVQSGGLFVSSAATAENYSDAEPAGHDYSSREVVNQLLIRQGRASHRDEARKLQDSLPAGEIAALLRDTTADEFLRVYQGSMGGMLDMPAVFGDGAVLPEGVTTSEVFAEAANYNVTPVILGTNRDEVKLFMMMSGEQTKTLFGIPWGLKDEEAYNRAAKYGSESWKVRGVDDIASRLVEAQGGGVYAYRFDWDEQKSVFGFDLATALGAAHGLEIAFVFGNFDGGFGLDLYDEEAIPARDALSESMMSYWANFAYTGSPGKGRDGKEIEWKPWSNGPDAERLLVLDTTRDKGIRMTTDLLTMDDLKQEFLADATMTAEEKCQSYPMMFQGEDFDAAELSALGCD